MHLSPCFFNANADASQPKPSSECDAVARMPPYFMVLSITRGERHSSQKDDTLDRTVTDLEMDPRSSSHCRYAMNLRMQERRRLRRLVRGGGKQGPSRSQNLFPMKVYIINLDSESSTYGHSQLRTGHPVRSAIHKQLNGRLVLRWVTTWESLLLYVLCSFCFLVVLVSVGLSVCF
jgi:hypothetical protein